ncbi:MAG: M20/M25/M40 family metallo-hydrolase [Gemmatimonadota bacterium]|nr:MAG: M20/M25/M40 family metallo-hydrolase [Gemmatimonadota bacterium]
MRRLEGLLVVAALATPLALSDGFAQIAQERVDLGVVQLIREEGLQRSQIAELGGHLTDVIGPRLTGSPGMREANEWTAEILRGWGLENVTIEPWGEFGRGWDNLSYSGRIVEPYVQVLSALPVAWTAGSDGTIAGPAVVIEEVDSVADLEVYRGKLDGAFVLAREPQEIAPEFEPRPLRTSLDDLLAPAEEQRPRFDPAEREQMMQRWRRERAMRDSVADFLATEGIAGLLMPSSRTYGILRVWGNNSGRRPENEIPGLELAVSHEQYGQIYRNVQRGIPVQLEIDVENKFYDDDLMAYNTLAEIPGTDKADEYVILGGHLDSWYAGTGATDNAAGCIVMMEAVRILKALDLKPRRTIRIALWSGEEQGLLGSRNWVQNHEDLWPRISAYVNVDNGTGRVRGIWDQENEAVIPLFEQILWPFRDLGVVAVKHGNTGGTDHLSFDRQGIPGFNFIQDPIEYSTRTHHTFADRYERLVIDDLKQAAVVVAATVYHLAMRDEMVPRKPPERETATN